jgi:superfamily II DNA or RNA helicase
MTDALHGLTAVLSERLWLPYDMFDAEEGDSLRRRLTVSVKGYQSDKPPTIIKSYEGDRARRMVGVPIHYGLKLLQKQGVRVETLLSDGFQIWCPKRPDPKHPSASPNQEILMAKVVESARGNVSTLIKAPTGAGKTVVALNGIAELGKTALVIVATKVLARQWEREAILHLGLRPHDIGHVEGGKCSYEGKAIVIAVMVNLLRPWPALFYRYFGTVVWDEAHRLGAAGFSKTMGLFPARHRIALTATPTRRDGAEQLFLDYFGPPDVEEVSEALPAEVRVINRVTNLKAWKFLSLGQIISRLTMDVSRNMDVVMLVKTLFKANRNVLVLSDRVAQLESLMQMSTEGDSPIPAAKMGLFVGHRTGSTPKSKVKVTEAELDEVRKSAQVVFSTYGMGKEGLDIQRLDAGIDASPRADGVQAIGRIRRPMVGKPKPVWFTFRDKGIPPLVGFTTARLRNYAEANVTIKDHA